MMCKSALELSLEGTTRKNDLLYDIKLYLLQKVILCMKEIWLEQRCIGNNINELTLFCEEFILRISIKLKGCGGKGGLYMVLCEYTECYIAFLDMLGFKELVYKSFCNDINEIFKTFNRNQFQKHIVVIKI